MLLNPTGRRGELRLTFTHTGRHTTLVENYTRPPLQVMRAIPDRAGCLCIYLLSPSGGVVQNDQYHIDICLNPHAHALFTTPSATRVYRMPDGCAQQMIRMTLGENAVLEFVPDATILFTDAEFQQTIDVTLQPGALLILQDIVMPGRLARHERFQFRRYTSRLTVRDQAGLVLFDKASVVPSAQSLMGEGQLENFACWGSFYWVGDLAAWNVNADAFCRLHADLLNTTESIGGLSPLQRGGLCARMLSHRLEPISTTFEFLRQATRETLGLPVERLRK
jgi:urease accessory protein